MAITSQNINSKNSQEALLEQYVEDISRDRLLSEDEERELSALILAGDQQAKDRLVKANLRFVVSIARQYVTDGVDILDLINEGNIGLIKAAGKYDATQGQRFAQYAVWEIRKAIEASMPQEAVLMNRTAAEHLPGNGAAADGSIADITATEEMSAAIELLPEREQIVLSEYYGLNGEQLTMAEIGQKYGWRRERVRQIRNRGLRRLHSYRNINFK